MEGHYRAGLVHVGIVFTLLCFVMVLACAYADGDFDRWCDWAVERGRRVVVSIRHRVR